MVGPSHLLKNMGRENGDGRAPKDLQKFLFIDMIVYWLLSYVREYIFQNELHMFHIIYYVLIYRTYKMYSKLSYASIFLENFVHENIQIIFW